MTNIALALISLLIIFIVKVQRTKRRENQRQQKTLEERKRIQACGETVMYYANNFGYIARAVMSRTELEKVIDGGITAQDLSQEIAQRIDAKDGISLGHQVINGRKINVKLPQELRDRHAYIIGKSGFGKTNLLRNLIFQDLEQGNGIGVIAPEQEMLTEEILPYIKNRWDDVIYFNPADTERPVCFNPLQVDDGEDIDIKVDEFLTIFKRVIGAAGPRMEEILRQALYTLVGRPGATLLDIEKLLDRTNPEFRTEVINTCHDEQLIHFWRDVYSSFPKDAHLPVTNRLNRLLRPRAVRNILCNPNRSLNFREAMDSGKIMLFNLSDGILGEQNSQLLGQLIVAKFQLAVMSRAQIPKEERRNFYLYCDEFQTFCGTSATSYEKILSRARKYKLGLILGHQQSGQIPSELLKEILGNVSTTICFQVSREDALKFSKELIVTHNEEISTVPEEEILRLKIGQAWCKIGQHSFLLHTALADQHPDRERAQQIIERARQNYGVPAITNTRTTTHAEPMVENKVSASGNKQRARKPKQQSTPAILDELDPSNIFDE